MPPKKTTATAPSPVTARHSAAASTSINRKPWVKKTPVEVVLEQIHKQEEKVAEMRDAISHEERELSKLQQAKKVLESV